MKVVGGGDGGGGDGGAKDGGVGGIMLGADGSGLKSFSSAKVPKHPPASTFSKRGMTFSFEVLEE